MEITNIVMAMRITKENNMIGMDMYISNGDRIKVTLNEGTEFVGNFARMELGTYPADGEDDTITVISDDGTYHTTGIMDIKDIIEL